jgi:hypothetical protein
LEICKLLLHKSKCFPRNILTVCFNRIFIEGNLGSQRYGFSVNKLSRHDKFFHKLNNPVAAERVGKRCFLLGFLLKKFLPSEWL